jgi:hypothetical protein
MIGKEPALEQAMARQGRGKAADERLSRELEDTFPASDPPSILRRSPSGDEQGDEKQVSEAASTQELVIELLSDDRAAQARVAPGWWALDSAGKPVLGPFASHDAALEALRQRRK